MPTPYVHKGNISLLAPPRSDGYRPISHMLWTFSLFAYDGSPEAYRYVLSTARRLDIAHTQFERARDALALAKSAPMRSRKHTRLLLEATSEFEMAVIAISRAFNMAEGLKSTFKIHADFPKSIRKRLHLLRELRDSVEHIDERALGRTKSKTIRDPLAVFETLSTIVSAESIHVGEMRLSIDQLTATFIAVRNFVVKAWGELCVASRNSQEPAAGP